MRAEGIGTKTGAIDKIVSELLAALAAQEALPELSRLAKKLAGLRASDAQPRAITSRRQRPRRPGLVLDAVVRAFGDRDGPMRLMEIHAAMERQLGQSVSTESVSWCLRMGTRGLDPRFIRPIGDRRDLRSASQGPICAGGPTALRRPLLPFLV
jgi:hypothetical protein